MNAEARGKQGRVIAERIDGGFSIGLRGDSGGVAVNDGVKVLVKGGKWFIWAGDGASAPVKPVSAPKRVRGAAAPKAAEKRLRDGVGALWAASKPARPETDAKTGAKNYLAEKQLGENSDLRVAAHDFENIRKGDIITAARDGKGELSAVQVLRLVPVAGRGKKDSLRGGTMNPTLLEGLPKAPKEGGVMYIAEGYATARTIGDLTGAAVMQSFGSGQFPKAVDFAAGMMKAEGRAWRVVVVADNDEAGRKWAEAAVARGKELGLEVETRMPERAGHDLNDEARVSSVRALATLEGGAPAEGMKVRVAPAAATPPEKKLPEIDIAGTGQETTARFAGKLGLTIADIAPVAKLRRRMYRVLPWGAMWEDGLDDAALRELAKSPDGATLARVVDEWTPFVMDSGGRKVIGVKLNRGDGDVFVGLEPDGKGGYRVSGAGPGSDFAMKPSVNVAVQGEIWRGAREAELSARFPGNAAELKIWLAENRAYSLEADLPSIPAAHMAAFVDAWRGMMKENDGFADAAGLRFDDLRVETDAGELADVKGIVAGALMSGRGRDEIAGKLPVFIRDGKLHWNRRDGLFRIDDDRAVRVGERAAGRWFVVPDASIRGADPTPAPRARKVKWKETISGVQAQAHIDGRATDILAVRENGRWRRVDTGDEAETLSEFSISAGRDYPGAARGDSKIKAGAEAVADCRRKA